MPDRIKLSIIICTYNRAELLIKCLEALNKQDLSNELFEIIIIDNNSTDKTKELIEPFLKETNNLKYYLEEVQGLSFARNSGIKEAKGEYIAYIDDDAIAVTDWASSIINAFENIKPSPLSVGGPSEPFYEKEPPEWYKDTFEIRNWGNKGKFLTLKEVKFGFSGLNMAFQSKVLADFQGFSTQLGVIGNRTRMGEEADLYYRIYKQNLNKAESILWYEPKMKIKHWTGIRNFKVKYRMERSFKAGEAIAMIENPKFSFFSFFRILIYLFLQPLHFLFNVFKFNNPLKTDFVIFLQNISYSWGYLTQIFNL